MNFAVQITGTLQVIAAFLIFVAVYLALAVSIIVCFVISELIASHLSVFRESRVRPVSSGARVQSGFDGGTRTSPRQHLVFHN